jgi:carbamoyltransferase
MNILGLYSGFSINNHDPGASLIRDGRVIAVCEEERFSRIKSSRGLLPIRSIRSCLGQAGLKISDIDLVVSPGETLEHLADKIAAYLKHYFGSCPPIRLVNHQTAHLASAFFPSGFEKAMCMSYDNSGDRLSGEFAIGESRQLKVISTIDNRNSLGRFYALMTQFLGFEAGEDEYKVMGLAPYGNSRYDLSDIVRPTSDGYLFNSAYFRDLPPVTSVYEPFYSEKLVKLLGRPRLPGEPIDQRIKDIAFSTQQALEACAISLVTKLHADTGLDDLCIAGGVALNCSANGKLSQLPFVRRLFVQPAASDRGLALGCALLGAYDAGQKVDTLEHVYCSGPEYGTAEIAEAIKLSGLKYEEQPDPSGTAAEMLADGKIIGWFQGRSEFGPRALGHRSILADPRRADMKERVNARIKFREEFRPFAPAVLEERAEDYFDMPGASPFMTVAYAVHDQQRSAIPAVTHVNGTARVQTVGRATSPEFHSLIERFGEITGVPVVLNTSFNLRGQPIVESPADAIATFAASGMDATFMGPFLIKKM